MENIKKWKIKSSTSSLNLCVPEELAQVAVIEAQEWQGFPNTDKEWEILPPHSGGSLLGLGGFIGWWKSVDV